MKNKILLTILILSTLFTSCQKEYSQLNKENEIELTITGVKYVTTVNGSTGNYWKVTLQSNKALSVDYIVSYEFYDGTTRMTLNHTINCPYIICSQRQTINRNTTFYMGRKCQRLLFYLKET